MKKNQLFEMSGEGSSRYLERKLHQIARAGHAVQNILHCTNAAQVRFQDKDGEFNYLDKVEIGALDDAIVMLGEFIRKESNDLCASFGLVREY